jgi:SAM-dependent methyltransferase
MTALPLSRRRALAGLAAAIAVPARARAQQNAGPYVPTPWKIVDDMLRLAAVGPGDFVVDLGSGDGRLVIAAAARFGARGYGVDIDARLVRLATENALKAGVADRVRFERRDLFETSLSDATVLTLYLLPDIVTQLVPRILAQMPAGARVVSHDYALEPWPADRHVQFELPEKAAVSGTARTVLYLYTVPARLGGAWRLELPAVAGQEAARLTFDQHPAGTRGSVVIGSRQVALDGVWIRGAAVRFVIPGLTPASPPVALEGMVRGDIMEGTAAVPGAPVPWRATRVADTKRDT